MKILIKQQLKIENNVIFVKNFTRLMKIIEILCGIVLKLLKIIKCSQGILIKLL